MPSVVKNCAAYRGGRVALLLLAALLLPACAAALNTCGQTEPSSLSDAARAILELNQALGTGLTTTGVTGTGPTPRIAGAPASSRRTEAGVLQSRAELLRGLMVTHPGEVRSVMLPAELATRLMADPANAPYVEHEAALSGALGAVEVDALAEGVTQRVYVLHDPSTAAGVAVHSADASGLHGLLHRRLTIAGVQVGADLLAETLTPLVPGEVETGSPQRLALGAAAVPPSNTTLTCSTTGQQRTAVLLLQFPNNTPAFPGTYGTAAWWQQAIAGTGNSVNSLWSEMTAGGTYATVDVYGPLTLSQSYGCADYMAMRSAALTAASNTIDLSRYTRIVLGFPASSCSFGGLADIGCNGADAIVPHPYSVVWMPIATTYTASTGVWASLAHELGHNLGLNHANTLDFGTLSLGPIDFQATNPGTVGGTGTTTAAGAVTAVNTEYGDVSSAMGNPWTAGPGPYSAEHRARLLGWVPSSGSSNGLGTVSAAGSYTIQPASTGTALRSLRVLRDAASASWLWLEYRNGGTPFDAANLAAMTGQNATQGAIVQYENGYGDHDKTFRLDMTPTGRGNNFADGALLPGVTWSDPYSPLSLTVNGINVAGLSVSVRYDSTCAAFSAGSSPVGAAGGSGTVNVFAPSTCSWRASSNAAWMTLAGTVSGTGNGSFTWTAAANVGAGQRGTYLTVGRSSQRLIQLGSGANVLAISPVNTTVEPGSSNVLSLTLEDAAGITDLRTVELDATAAGTPPCTVVTVFSSGVPYLYLLDPVSNEFTTGLAAGSSDSLSTTACTLSGSGSGVSVSGSTITLAMKLSFPTAAPGARAMYATANLGTELPLGVLNVGTVTATQTNPTTMQPTSLAATTTTLTARSSAALPGVPVVLSAAVAPVSGTAVPTGTVTLMDGTAALSTVALDSTGRASLTAATLTLGTHSLTAVYGGDSANAGSTSAGFNVTVAQAATTTVLASSVARVNAGGGATLTVSVSHAAGTVEPGGTLTLRGGGNVLATAPLSHAAATASVSGLTLGTHTYTAAYSGDTTYAASTSNAVTITVDRVSTLLTLSATPTVLAGGAIHLTVTASGTTAAMPSGGVELQEGTRSLGSVTLANGTGTLDLASLATGTHSLTATYAGDGTFGAADASVAINVVDFAVTAPGGSAGITVVAGALTGNTATLTLTPGSSGFPLRVSFACNGAPADATCTVTPGAVTPGGASIPVTVIVSTTARSSSKVTTALPAWIGVPLLGLLVRRRIRRSALQMLAALAVALTITAGMAGCGTGVSGSQASTVTTTTGTGTSPSGGGTPAGSSTLTVQAVANANGATLTHSATMTLQVN